jgi:hypothetical protein
MLPEIDVKQLMDRLPEPIALNKGQTWTQNLGLSTDASKAPQKAAAQTKQIVVDERPLQFSGNQHRQQ